MSDHRRAGTWAVARLLLTDHLPLVPIVWVAFAAVVALVVLGIAVFGTVTRSVWDPAASLLRWLALGYGTYVGGRLLPMYVAHGRTRREVAAQAALFLVVAVTLFAVLLGLGYALEAALYRAMDWPHQLSTQRAFTSAGQLPLIVATYCVVLGAWTLAGALLAAGFYRSEELGVATIPAAIVVVLMAGAAVDYATLPFVGRLLAGVEPNVPAAVALGAGSVLLGAAATWAIVRDLPLRNRVAR